MGRSRQVEHPPAQGTPTKLAFCGIIYNILFWVREHVYALCLSCGGAREHFSYPALKPDSLFPYFLIISWNGIFISFSNCQAQVLIKSLLVLELIGRSRTYWPAWSCCCWVKITISPIRTVGCTVPCKFQGWSLAERRSGACYVFAESAPLAGRLGGADTDI